MSGILKIGGDEEGLTELLQLGAHYLDVVDAPSRAQEIYERTIHDFPNDFRAYFNLGHVYAIYNELDEAMVSYEKALALSPYTIDIYGTITGLLIKMHRPKDAAQMCYMGLTLDPLDRTCLYNANIALRQIGSNHMDEALKYTWDALSVLVNRKVAEKKSMRRVSEVAELDHSNTVTDNDNEDSRAASASPSKNESFFAAAAAAAAEVASSSNTTVSSSSSGQAEHVTYVCVKWGAKYDAVYVNSLYHSIASNHTTKSIPYKVGKAPFTFICFTDNAQDIDPRIKCRPFPTGGKGSPITKMWNGWWLKCCIFAPPESPSERALGGGTPSKEAMKPLAGWIVYLDLDTVLAGNLDIWQWSADDGTTPNWDINTFYTLSANSITNERRACGINSSVMIWYNGLRGNRYAHIYQFLLEYYTEVNLCIYKFDHYLEMMLYNRSVNNNNNNNTSNEVKTIGGISLPTCSFTYLQDLFPGLVVDFLSLASTFMKKQSSKQSLSGSCHTDEQSEDEVLPPLTLYHQTQHQQSLSNLCKMGICIIIFPLEPKPLEASKYSMWIQEYFQISEEKSILKEAVQSPIMKHQHVTSTPSVSDAIQLALSREEVD
jgi:Tfp pilus assembly protein PilF